MKDAIATILYVIVIVSYAMLGGDLVVKTYTHGMVEFCKALPLVALYGGLFTLASVIFFIM